MMVVMHLNTTNGRHVYWGTADRPTGFCVMGGPIFWFVFLLLSLFCLEDVACTSKAITGVSPVLLHKERGDGCVEFKLRA